MNTKRRWASLALAALVAFGAGRSSAAPATQPVEGTMHPPIPIQFKLDQPGVVTLVIEDSQGKRVRNLLAETRFEAGEHTVYWDGLDEASASPGVHGIYEIAGKLVQPGSYQVRGLTHRGVELKYQFTAYNSGKPPWRTSDTSGGWTADHTPPCSVLFLPQQKQMMIGSYVAEAGDGLIWTDMTGRKIRGVRWLGGTWAAGWMLARDDGPKALKDITAYVASSWHEAAKAKTPKPPGELRLTATDPDGKTRTLLIKLGYESREAAEPRGLAARDGVVVVSLKDELLLVDAATAKGKDGNAQVIASIPLKEVGGILFDRDGSLLVVVDKAIHRYAVGDLRALKTLPEAQVVVDSGLELPKQMAVDPSGAIYVSDWGASHQVKVFDASGKSLRVIGKPGEPKVGPYDPDKMQRPHGLAISDDGRLWVAEMDFLPKRVSVWSLDGKLLTDFIGPPDYGAGGEMDPKDPTRFYYADWHAGGMELKLDWEKGTSKVVRVYHRPGKDDLQLETRSDGRGILPPQTPVYVGGQLYLTNQYNSVPTNFPGGIGIWQMRGDVAHLVAASGNAYRQPWLREASMDSRWPKEIDLKRREDERYMSDHPAMFVWSDLNNDGKAQAEEAQVATSPGRVVSASVLDDLSFLASTGDLVRPTSINQNGVPLYDLSKVQRVVDKPRHGDLVCAADGQYVQAGGPLRGYKDGQITWTYPNQWPSLHAGHSAPRQQYPGQLIATTKFIGANLQPKGANTQPMFAYNGDRGTVYLLTADGLFVSQLFKEEKGTEMRWSMPDPKRDMDVTNTAVPGENFFPRVVQTQTDGKLYVITGKNHSSIVRIDGLETLRPIPTQTLQVTNEQLDKVGPYLAQREAERQANQQPSELSIRVLAEAPRVDGKTDDWKDAQWVKVDDKVEAAMAVAGDRLYVVYRGSDGDFLANQPQSLPLLFKTGAALDVMLGGRSPGDKEKNRRLVVTRAEGKVMAAFYEPVVPGTADEKRVGFSSPWRTIYFDRVTDVSKDVQFAAAKFTEEVIVKKQPTKVNYVGYEFSIPLATVKLSAEVGQSVRGDIGILRGPAGETNQRLYWHNKGSSLVNDVPGEAELQPALWGTLKFTK